MNKSSELSQNINTVDDAVTEIGEQIAACRLNEEEIELEEQSKFALKLLERLYENKGDVPYNLEKRIKAIGTIMAETGEFFNAKGKSHAGNQGISLANVAENILESITHYCYPDVVRINEGSVKQLLLIATAFQVKPIIGACCNYIMRLFEHTSCLKYQYFAVENKLMELAVVSTAYVQENFFFICKEDEFLHSNYKQIAKLLDDNQLNIKTEVDVCEAVLNWISQDANNRKDKITYFLPKLKLPLLDVRYLSSKIDPLCTKSQDRELIFETLRHKVSPTCEMKYLKQDQLIPRRINETTTLPSFIFYLYKDDYTDTECKLYNLETREWLIVKFFPEFMVEFPTYSIAKNNDIVIVGGYNDIMVIESFDLRMKTRNVLDFTIKENQFCNPIVALIDDDHIYFVYEDKMRSFDLKISVWEELITFTNKLTLAGVLVIKYNDIIYIFESKCPDEEHIFILIYDVFAKSLKRVKSRSNLFNQFVLTSAFIFKNAICFEGSEVANKAKKKILSYNPNLNKWQLLNSTFFDLECREYVIVDNKLLIIDWSDHICYEYDAENNKWKAHSKSKDGIVKTVEEFPKFKTLYCPKMSDESDDYQMNLAMQMIQGKSSASERE